MFEKNMKKEKEETKDNSIVNMYENRRIKLLFLQIILL